MPTALPLPQLVDLALGTPEVGAVNFNVLHALLHAIISKLNIQDVKADIHDYDRDSLQALQTKARVTVTTPQSDNYTTRGNDDSVLDESISETKSIITERSPYHSLERRMDEIARHLEELNALPTTHELFQRVKSSKDEHAGKDRPVTDMWQALKLKKKCDANEEGVSKLMAMMEDMMKEVGDLRTANALLQDLCKANADKKGDDDLLQRIKDLEKINAELNQKLADLQSFQAELNNRLAGLGDDFTTFVKWPQLEEAILGLRTEMHSLKATQTQETVISKVEDQAEEKKAASRPSSGQLSIDSRTFTPSTELLNVFETLGSLDQELALIKARMNALEEELKKKVDYDVFDRLNLTDLAKQLNNLKNDMKSVHDGISKESDALSRIQELLRQLEDDVVKLNNTAQELTDDKRKKEKQIQDLHGQCLHLEEKKADKEYVAMEVEVKADKKQLETKVNHSVFDSTTHEINGMIKEILDKLIGNESEWKDLLTKLASDLDGKLDRHELAPLKQWLESKLKALSKKIQPVTTGSLSEDEAAGLKKQLLHFHCLSCDKPVDLVPTGVVSNPPVGYALPPSRSPRPYTIYELEQFRQQARSYGSPEPADYYSTTRQCGGMHTLTHPHKRTSRISQNISQYLKEEDGELFSVQKGEIDVQGADGHIYKGRKEPVRLEARIPGQTTANRSQNNTSTPKHSISAKDPSGMNGISKSGMHSRPQSAKTARSEQRSLDATTEKIIIDSGEIIFDVPVLQSASEKYGE